MKTIQIIVLWLWCTGGLQAQINPQNIVGVIFKTGMEDRGIPYFEDMSFGISGKQMVDALEKMRVNTLVVQVCTTMVAENRSYILKNFVTKLVGNGGGKFKIILDERKWDLEKETQQESWANQIAFAYNAIKSIGFDTMVVGCAFDENRPLNDSQSSQQLWVDYHTAIPKAMDKLNSKTDNAFKTRTVLIHGKGYGSQFLGVKASEEITGFKKAMQSRCANYGYNFKYFQAGMPEQKTLEGWKDHFKTYCSFKEVAECGVPMVFVGDAGDGLRANAFVAGKNPYGGPGQYVIRALRDVFVGFNWSGAAFGVFIKDGIPDSLGATILHAAYNSQFIERTDIVDSWHTWFNTTRPANTPITPGKNVLPVKLRVSADQSICIQNNHCETLNIAITNTSGRKVFATKTAIKQVIWPLKQYGRGLYIVSITSGMAYINQKIVVE